MSAGSLEKLEKEITGRKEYFITPLLLFSSFTNFTFLFFRTHIYFLDFDENLLSHQPTKDLTLAAHLSIDRLHMLEPLAQQWPGK
jgi:hypothetical protein